MTAARRSHEDEGDLRSQICAPGRSAGGAERADPVFQPNNGDVTQTIQAPDLPGRFSFLTNKPASLPPRRMNLLRNEPLDVLQKV